MTRLVDRHGWVVGITMTRWNGSGYDPDWSGDFFEVGGLNYNETEDAYEVEDVGYCIDQAEDCINCVGDCADNTKDEDAVVFIEWLEL